MGTHMTFDKYIHTLFSEEIINGRMESCMSRLSMAVKTEKHFYPEDASQKPIPQVPGLIQFIHESLVL